MTNPQPTAATAAAPAKKPELCCIGHITLDKIITPKRTVHMPGGTAFYFAHGISGLDHSRFQLVTSLAPSEMKAVDDIRAKGIDVKVIPGEHSVYFENKYGANQNDRTQRVLAKAQPFTVENLRDVEAQTFHLGTLLADDFSPEVIRYLSEKGTVSVDAQGYLREVRGQDVVAVDWPAKMETLKYIDIIKANEKEMEVIAGTTDAREAARRLHQWGAHEVILTFGDQGSLIYVDGEYIEVPAIPMKGEVVDATGCGDTYMTGYLYSRNRGASRLEAGRFAAAMCTLMLGYSGPFNGTEADILQLMKTA